MLSPGKVQYGVTTLMAGAGKSNSLFKHLDHNKPSCSISRVTRNSIIITKRGMFHVYLGQLALLSSTDLVYQLQEWLSLPLQIVCWHCNSFTDVPVMVQLIMCHTNTMERHFPLITTTPSTFFLLSGMDAKSNFNLLKTRFWWTHIKSWISDKRN